MNLLIWRHAEAEDNNAGGDLPRNLTRHGERQAAEVAKWMKKRLPSDYELLVSPANRTRQTADALSTDYRIVEALAPGAEATAYVNAAGWSDSSGDTGRTVILVGHQPSVGRVVALLVSGKQSEWSIKKGAVWWIESRDRGDLDLIVRAVMSPGLA